MNTQGSRRLSLLFLVVVAWIASGCRTQDIVVQEEPEKPETQVTTSSGRILPTIYPTNTPLPAATPTATRLTEPTPVPDTPVSFDQVAVKLQYRIPGLGLERTIQGTVINQIEVIDELTGESVIRRDQPGVLLELQQALANLELAELPGDCEYCVQLEYELPLAEVTGAGWLTDPRLLASLENYTAVLLGAHFPENTIIGLRRSASPLYAAHTLSLTEDGQFYFWTAVDSEILPPQPADQELLSLIEEAMRLETESLADKYSATCAAELSLETIFIRNDAGEKTVTFECPEYSLPTSMTSIYQALDEAAAEAIGDDSWARPETNLPLDSLVFYRREDGFNLNLYEDGIVSIIGPESSAYTGTVTTTLMISMTAGLIESADLSLGVESLVEDSDSNVLLVRGESGVYDARWRDGLQNEIAAFVAWLDDLVDIIISVPPTPQAQGTPTLTPSPTARATSSP